MFIGGVSCIRLLFASFSYIGHLRPRLSYALASVETTLSSSKTTSCLSFLSPTFNQTDPLLGHLRPRDTSANTPVVRLSHPRAPQILFTKASHSDETDMVFSVSCRSSRTSIQIFESSSKHVLHDGVTFASFSTLCSQTHAVKIFDCG